MCIAALILFVASSLSVETNVYCSPAALCEGTSLDTVFVADAGTQRILSVDLPSGKVTTLSLRQTRPSGIVGLKSKPWLLVTLGKPLGQVVCLDTETGKELFTFAVGHSPYSPILSKDESTLYVCNRFDNQVAAYNLVSRRERWKTSVPREPVAASLTPDGSKVVVANLLPIGAATSRPFAAAVSILDAADGSILANIVLPNGSTGLLGVTMSPDGRYAYVTHTLGRYQSPTKQVEFGWMNTNAFSVIDLSALKTLATVLVDDLELGAANPWGIACSDDGAALVVAHAGSQELSIVDLKAVHAKLDRLAKGEAVSTISTELACVQNDLEFLKGIRRRIGLPGEGPRSVILSGTSAITAEYFAGKLAVVDFASQNSPREIALGITKEPDPTRRGEMLFSSAKLCSQQWQSCASCHPDARMDGFNWDLLNDGNGNPKNVKSMLLSHANPPAMWMGVRENAEGAVRAGFRYIQFAEVSEPDAQAVDAYLKSLTPVPGPVAVNPEWQDSIMRGKRTFEEARCIQCHSGKYFTDGKSHDMGTTKGIDEGKPVITPTLIECWRTAPYLHDGRDASLPDVLHHHGQANKLSAEEQRDLVNFLLSL